MDPITIDGGMTIESLLEMPTTVAGMSEKQLEDYCRPFWPQTRPANPINPGESVDQTGYAPEIAEALAKLKKPSLLSSLKRK